MRCREFVRWLDEGLPEPAAECVRHARSCAACADALLAARAIESALQGTGSLPSDAVAPCDASDAIRAPEGFTHAVMMRVTASGAATVRAAREHTRERWWLRLAADPVSAVSATFALVLALITATKPLWLQAGIVTAMTWTRRWTAAWSAGLQLDPTAWFGIALAVSPFVLWFVWVSIRAFARALVLHATRPGV